MAKRKRKGMKKKKMKLTKNLSNNKKTMRTTVY